MNEQDKADLIQWLAARGYSIQSISDSMAGPMPTLQIVDGKVIQVKSTTVVIQSTKTYSEETA